MKKILYVSFLSASLFSACASASSTLVDVPAQSGNSSAVSDDTSATSEGDLDISRIPMSPGLHVVPLNESPFVGALAAKIEQDIAEQSSRGVHTAEDIPDVRASLAHVRSSALGGNEEVFTTLSQVKPHLYYEPASISQTLLEGLPLVDVSTAGGNRDGRWTGLSRSWEVAGLGLVQLDESEYADGGGSVTVIKEWLNTDINGQPGTIQTMRGPDGATQVSLGWVTDHKVMRLNLQPVDPDALAPNQEALLTMARSIRY